MSNKKQFEKVPSKVDFFKLESETIKFWKENKVFERSVEERPKDNAYTFYDGPPFITGSPHHGSLLPSIAKDVIPRYQTMKGKRVRRVWGWDCHGLPAENKVEEKLGLENKKQIEDFGIGNYIKECRNYVNNVSAEWEWYIDHIGRWVDFKNSYKTMDLDYMESVMWAFSKLYEKGLIYKGRRTSLYCPRCSTPLSNFEIAMDNSYKDVTDPAITIKFKVKDQDYFVLAWTTTPWTLPANLALAVNKDEDYIKAEVEGENYIVAEPRSKEVFEGKQVKVLEKVKGKDLVGLEYEPLYTYYPAGKNDYKIYHGDFVSMDDGTGIVHIAPGFGEDDAQFGKAHKLSVIDHVDEDGKIVPKVEKFAGLFVKKADRKVIEDLVERDLLYAEKEITHSYPFCYRCETPLIYKSQEAWYLNIEEIRQKMLDTNENINWVPKNIKTGRFKQGLKSAPDWCLSRSRYWASPIPVWECSCGERFVPSSIKELEKASGQEVKDLHKPGIDEITVKCAKCGKEVKRVPEVLDCWFESGSMPYAERHYPMENEERFKKEFPGDYIIEYIAQTRGWFYTLHVLANALFDSQAFNNCIVTGVIMGTDGRKMSKLFKNYPDPKKVLEKYGGEALRLYFMSSVVMLGQNMNINEKDIEDRVKKVLIPLWNCLKYLVIYAQIHDWTPDLENKDKSKDVLDVWMENRTNLFVKEFEEGLKNYRIPDSARLVQPFIEDVSRWFIRQSRQRFVDGDKHALQTLWETLVKFAKTTSPLIPFITEEMWKRLVLPFDDKAKESIHLEIYPEQEEIDMDILEKMSLAREIVEQAHAQRQEAGIKIRQPLAKFTISNSKFKKLDKSLISLIKEEINVKEIVEGKKAKLDTKLTPELEQEGKAREIIRNIQVQRRKSKLDLEDKIVVTLPSWPEKFAEEIKAKTNTVELKKGENLKILKKD